MKFFFCVLFLLASSFLLLSCGVGNSATPGGGNGGGTPCTAQTGTTCESLTINGASRTYLLHIPANFQKNSGALVIVLHGSGSNGLQMEAVTGFSSLADQAGFAVAYPDGLLNTAIAQTDWAYYFNDFTDDVSFVRQLIATLQSRIGPSPKRIFVTGHSAGGFMSHRLAAELSDLVAAIGVVEGAIDSNGNPPPVPSPVAPVSVLILHGDQDQTVLYCGSPIDASQEDSFNYWIGPSADNCSTLNPPFPLCDSQGNITTVVAKDATGCTANTEVKFYKLIGGTHAWFSGPMNDPTQAPYNPGFGSSTGITTTEILWNFFASHPKP
jgi:polyhydroxybutyrate depolymerase